MALRTPLPVSGSISFLNRVSRPQAQHWRGAVDELVGSFPNRMAAFASSSALAQVSGQCLGKSCFLDAENQNPMKACRREHREFFGAQLPHREWSSLFREGSRHYRVQTAVASVAAAPSTKPAGTVSSQNEVRVRFAPSPTGSLHVGGARTALFNWLYVRAQGGKFILRIEDTDLERSTRKSEEEMVRDLKWLGLDWDEGPDKPGDVGPYRQSERTSMYKSYVDKLVAGGYVYPCFCTDEELDAMRKEQEEKKLPPKYAGKWSRASKEEVEAEFAKGSKCSYRFRVPQDKRITIQDLIRGEVSWNTDTLGDFVVLRSNGQPVYNFCVVVDDATMKVSHVIRAEEHLPNTLRQVLIYQALGFPLPQFGHVSLILAPDRSKLSKRHGATSVGQFKEMGFLPDAMVNYLALLGWNDGTEEEIFSVSDIVSKFSIERITKSAAVFDKTKLNWMNGQHLRSLPVEQLQRLLSEQWTKSGILTRSEGPVVDAAVELVKNGIDLVSDADAALLNLLAYDLQKTVTSAEAKDVVADDLAGMAAVTIAAFESGELAKAAAGGHDEWQKWVKSVGKPLKRKGKRLFMPLRILLTGRMQGPDVGATLALLATAEASGDVSPSAGLVTLSQRIDILRSVDWAAAITAAEKAAAEKAESDAPTPVAAH